MLYLLFSCTISSSPHINPELQTDLDGINHHLQHIEMLSNELHIAVKEQNREKTVQLIEQLKKSNTELQQQGKQFRDHLNPKTATPQSP